MTSVAHPIDIGILVIFLVVTLVVGLRYGRSVKTLRDYALGGKNFSTSTLVATIVATWSSGSSLFISIENTYSHGLYYIIAALGMPIGILLSGRLVIRMEEFMNNVSVAEAMGDIYGRAASGYGFKWIVAKVGYTAIQFTAMSKMLQFILNLDSPSVTVVAAGIVIVYSTQGVFDRSLLLMYSSFLLLVQLFLS